MDPTAEPTDGDSNGAEHSEPEHVTPQVTTPEPADLQADATPAATPEPADLQADVTPAATPEAGWAPLDAGAPQFATPGGQPVPQYGASPIVAEPGLAPALPSQPSVFDRHRTLIVLAGIGVAVLVAVLAIVVAALTSPANSTLNVRVIVPAPASAGGLSNDFADESSPQFQAGLAQFRQRYVSKFAQHVSSYTAAIYTNAAAGQPVSTASVAVLYLGFNSTGDPIDPATAVSSAIDNIEKSIHGTTSTVHVSGLPGDTSAECVGSLVSGHPVAVCVWATDKTVSLIATLIPGTDVELASMLKKMRPDLVRG